MLEEGINSLISNFGFGESITESLAFFIYDSIKIILLMFIVIFVAGFFRSYINREKLKSFVKKAKFGLGNFTASLFGSVTPFCSCSSIPIFMGFLETGIPLGVTFSFLITSPIINEYLVILMLAFFGWKITLAYVIFGLIVGTLGGIILGKMNLEKEIIRRKDGEKEEKFTDLKSRLNFGYKEARRITKETWLWIIIGVGIGALIHNFVPEEIFQGIIAEGGWLTVPIAVLLGVPLYANCAAILPVAYVLFEKGLPLGTTLAFMMASAALSLPEAIILRKMVKIRLIGIFFGVTAVAIVIIGYLFNYLQGILV